MAGERELSNRRGQMAGAASSKPRMSARRANAKIRASTRPVLLYHIHIKIIMLQDQEVVVVLQVVL